MTMRLRANRQTVILATLLIASLSDFPRASSALATGDAVERSSLAHRISGDDSGKRRAMDALARCRCISKMSGTKQTIT